MLTRHGNARSCTMLIHNEMQQEHNALFNCNHIKLKYTMVTIEKDIPHVAQNPEHHPHTILTHNAMSAAYEVMQCCENVSDLCEVH